MKFSKIYSDNSKFKSFKFNKGMNVVIGRITQEENRDIDTHNLGKSTLITLLDFMLLKEVSKNHIFVKHKNKFLDFTFYLEIELNSGQFITIKRSVRNQSKISFKLHKEQYQNYIHEESWDYEDLPLTTRNKDINPKIILNRYLEFDVLTEYNYRQSLNYFLRTQDDYNDLFHLKKFAGNDGSWKPFLFELLGFDGQNLINKYEKEESKKAKDKLIKEIEGKFSVSADKKDKIRGMIQIKENEKENLQNEIDAFNFLLKENQINEVLINDIEDQVSKLNTLDYNLRYEIKSINDSLKIELDYNFEDIKEVFDEVNIYFSDQLKRDYNELLKFNNKVTKERNKYLNETLIKKENELVKIECKLEELNNRRKELLSVLKEKDTFKKFKRYQSQIIYIENEISNLKNELDNIDVIKNINKELDGDKTEINKFIEAIDNQITSGNDLYSKIRGTFYELTQKIINKTGILSIEQNKSGNVEFHAEISNLNDELTSQGNGNTYKKILCACFDLAVLICYSSKSFYKFVYHDGILESLDNRKKLNYLDILDKLCLDNGLQIIITLIEDDLPYLDNKTKFQFNNNKIVLQLDDSPDNSGKLFSIEF
ncbi:DUF2326 domain-containing protein [Clostridium diolis]|uniref:DUF2326 domain-containing protein n=1 Tax=Clostridium diolis TaxID=223919 RepID=UPI003AF5E8C5